MSQYVNRFFSAVGSALEFNAATLSGAIDIIVVEDDDGVRRCSPFHVRFGKLQLLKSRGMAVDVWLNDVKTDLTLRLGTAGEAYFVAPEPDTVATTTTATANPLPGPLSADEQAHPVSPPAPGGATTGSGPSPTMLPERRDQALPATDASDAHSDVAAIDSARARTRAVSEAAADAAAVEGALASMDPGTEGAPAGAIVGGHAGASADAEPVVASRSGDQGGADAGANLGCHVGDGVCEAPAADRGVSPVVDAATSVDAGGNDSGAGGVAGTLRDAPAGGTSSGASLADGARSSSGKQQPGLDVPLNEAGLVPSAATSGEHLIEPSGLAARDASSAPSPPCPEDSPAAHILHFQLDQPEEKKAEAVIVAAGGASVAAGEPSPRRAHERTESLSAPLSRQLFVRDASSGSLVVRDVVEQDADDGSQGSSAAEDVLALSLCGSYITPGLSHEEVMAIFEQHRVAYSEFAASPSRIFANADLRCMVDRRLVPWAIAAPYIVSMLAYGVPLDLDRLTSPCGTGTTADVSEERRAVLEAEAKDAAAAAKAEAAAAAPTSADTEPRRRFSWFGLRSSYSQSDVGRGAQGGSGPAARSEQTTAPGLWSSVTSADETDRSSGERLVVQSASHSTPSPLVDDEDSSEDLDGGDGGVPDQGHRRTTKREVTGAVAAAVKGAVTHPLHPLGAADAAATAVEVAVEGGELLPRGRLSMRPTAAELSALPLRAGDNDVRFVVRSTLQGIQEVSAKIFLWHADDRVVISDVDGTITRSDLLGHLLPRVGRDWSHSGVAGLYTRIARNGYKIVYLTARPIGQAASTRAFLASLTQARGRQLPLGPLVMSPDRLVESLTREVIRRTPHEFKIAALRDIQRLFVPDEEDDAVAIEDDEKAGGAKEVRPVHEDRVVPSSKLALAEPPPTSAPVDGGAATSSPPGAEVPPGVPPPNGPPATGIRTRATSATGSGEATPERTGGSSSLLRSLSEGHYGVKQLVSSIPAISLGPASPATASLSGERLAQPPAADALRSSATGPLPSSSSSGAAAAAAGVGRDHRDPQSVATVRSRSSCRSSTPFHAGFGNRATDELSYRTVGLPPQRIFTINPAGELAVMNALYESTCSYSNLEALVESVFPDVGVRPLAQGAGSCGAGGGAGAGGSGGSGWGGGVSTGGGGGSASGRGSGSTADRDGPPAGVTRAVAASDSYNDFHYWKPPLPSVAADEFDSLL
ncbi:hypothetical protein MMPV_000604 [Pyropia vietnamensis]